MKQPETRQSNRCGFYAMWKYAPDTMKKFKVKKPGEFQENNIHNGKMWGSMQEWRRHRLSEDQVLEIVLEVYKGGASLSTMKLVRKTCSYLYNLATGIPEENFPGMKGVFKCINLKACTPSRGGVKPVHVPTADQLVHAFTTEWKPDCGLSLLCFLMGCLAAYDSHVLGSRPKADLNKIKESVTHDHDKARHNEVSWWTLQTLRVWCALLVSAHRICLCPEGKHTRPSSPSHSRLTGTGIRPRIPRVTAPPAPSCLRDA